ncbi:Leucine-rich repeat containing protein [Dorcoceras hygrometricum]|uniref:Leucine-rich repeat containing protein n=1 Tax=Dorcoceras hygrometricum TaxID=472368 RepID=A0A2Z7BML4_9LAMI|nr:Leucine-rich repeat containing protein [Dorcoceras hygrometricum]
MLTSSLLITAFSIRYADVIIAETRSSLLLNNLLPSVDKLTSSLLIPALLNNRNADVIVADSRFLPIIIADQLIELHVSEAVHAGLHVRIVVHLISSVIALLLNSSLRLDHYSLRLLPPVDKLTSSLLIPALLNNRNADVIVADSRFLPISNADVIVADHSFLH